MLIVEDGSGMSDSQSYASAQTADGYHALRGDNLWATLTIEQKESALIRAMDFLALYGPKWKGARVTETQALDWPRYDVRTEGGGYGRCATYAPTNAVPAAVVKATCEMALKAAAGELVKDAEREVVEETIGPITTKWAAGATAPQAQFTAVDLMLKPLLQSSSGVRLVRA